MPLGVLNNISAVYAENNLNQTQSSLQNVLTQLSSGSRINSGADDPAGLAISNGLAANSAALAQSSRNASEGAGFLQVADGALSQVTSLLTSAISLATEAGGGTLSTSQLGAANQEYQDILTQIGTIGATTEYNGILVFSGDQTTSALAWGANALGTGTSATGTSAAIAASAITAGGSAAAAAPVQTTTYGNPAAMSWTLNGTAGTSTLTSSVISNGAQLSGTLAFSPTTSGGTASSISINLANVTGSSLGAQATSLASLINAQAGNGDSDYTVTAIGNNQLQIGLGANAAADHITGFTSAPATNVSSSGAAAAQTGFTLAVADGGTLGGSISVTPNTAVAAGAQTAVNFTNNGATITANLPSADSIGGSITIGGTIPQTGGGATALSWGHSGAGVNETFSAAVNTANTLSGSFVITGTGDGHGPYTINLSDLQGENAAAMATTVLGDITTAGGTAGDYTVSYATGSLTIGLSGNGSETGISVANTGGGAATQTTPIVNPGGTTSPNKTIDLDNVTSANLQSTLNADLAGTDYSATYNSGSGALSFGISGAGTTAGITALTISGSPTVFKQTPASTTPGATANIPLTNVTTANLASTVAGVLNNGKTASNADYSVTYNSGTGTLNVALTPYATATDDIVSLTLSNAATEKTPTAASIQFTDGEQLSGEFTITPTISGVAASGAGITTVNLNGVNTSNLVATVNAALNGTSPGSASDFNVAYNVVSGVGTLTIAPNAVGLAADYDSVAIANGNPPRDCNGGIRGSGDQHQLREYGDGQLYGYPHYLRGRRDGSQRGPGRGEQREPAQHGAARPGVELHRRLQHDGQQPEPGEPVDLRLVGGRGGWHHIIHGCRGYLAGSIAADSDRRRDRRLHGRRHHQRQPELQRDGGTAVRCQRGNLAMELTDGQGHHGDGWKRGGDRGRAGGRQFGHQPGGHQSEHAGGCGSGAGDGRRCHQRDCLSAGPGGGEH